ncbi:uncharacterized protein LOC132178405 [Corylus avellana]|uniref:uncharacterized protein LOC132178405 n=1 Tax=Corylus avellana TaxID=13451 RepID=UPI001E20DD76|nr:uncharacterized protein LOC132178405 [Corylus avellana]
MYVTRHLSTYRRSPEALSLPPPEGPSSGILVIQDEESEPTCCFGLCKSIDIKHLPFPQNKSLQHRYSTGFGHTKVLHFQNMIFIPVLNQPLSSNLYYAIQYRKHKGEAYTCSTEEDETTCCFGGFATDVPPQPLDPTNVNQQFEIRLRGGILNDSGGRFTAKSVAPDGFPPFILGKIDWKVRASASLDFELGEAQGVDTTLRAHLPEFTFTLSNRSSQPVVVGKWYCPFMFVREGTRKTLKDTMSNLIYYEMKLEQKWEQIFACENKSEGNAVVVDALVDREVVTVGGREAVVDERNVGDSLVWFRSNGDEEEETCVALSVVIIERMKWEQERAGWVGGDGKQVRVNRVEEFGGEGGWKKFGCYVLVERFVLKRLHGGLVLSYDFKHTHQIRSKWE